MIGLILSAIRWSSMTTVAEWYESLDYVVSLSYFIQKIKGVPCLRSLKF